MHFSIHISPFYLKSIVCIKSTSDRQPQINLLSLQNTRIPLPTRVLQHNPAVAARMLRRPGHTHPHIRAPSVRQAFARKSLDFCVNTNVLLQVDAAYDCLASTAANGLLPVDAASDYSAPISHCRGGMGEAQRDPPRHSVEAQHSSGAPRRVGSSSGTPFLSSVH